MSSRLAHYIPNATGGSRFGLSFLKAWMTCPYQAALMHIAPHPTQGHGLVIQHKARPLLAGGLFHAAIEPWYRSRCIDPSTGQWREDNGQPDFERAMHELDTWAAVHANEWEDPVERDTDTQLCRSWLTRYHEHYGPTGTNPEFPNTRVYVDDTGPWVEREVALPIGEGLEATCRIDLVASDMGHPVVIEHKTTSASHFNSLRRIMHIGAQPTMELLALRTAQALPFTPVACVVNILNKNPGRGPTAKTPPFDRERVSRTDEELAHFTANLHRWLATIEGWLEEYEDLLAKGWTPWQAIDAVFPRTGTLTSQCYNYNRACEFWSVCASTGREPLVAGTYNPRYSEGQAVVTASIPEEETW